MDAARVTLSELGSGVTLSMSEPGLPQEIVIVDERGQVMATFGPPIEGVVVDDGRPPFSKRVTTKCECRGCGRVLARYTGGLRLTMARPRLAGIEVRRVDGDFVFDCQNPQCKVPPKAWPDQLLAAALREAWDQKHRRFTIT